MELSTFLYNEIISDPTFINSVKKNFVVTGEVYSADLDGNKIPGTKTYAFVGSGCGITYLTFDARSSKAKQVSEVVSQVRRDINNYLFKTFSLEEVKYFEQIGCPVMAVLQQDQQIQIEFYSRIVKIAKEKLGIKKISYRSILD